VSRRPTVLAVSPHPDDELLGAGATLMALRDAGWRVVNLACGLGRPADRERRRAELREACARAGFELVLPEPLPELGGDPGVAAVALCGLIAGELRRCGASLAVAPSPHDCHPVHELAGRALRDAVAGLGAPLEILFWALWGELPCPTELTGFDAPRLDELLHALAAHAGELARNRYARLLEHRAAANAVLGPERVAGFGAAGIDAPFAELLTRVRWDPGSRRWELAGGPSAGADVGWWLHARSARSQLTGSERRG
jgi:LmbE family N-acetylglucosaminyl deacetylase